MPDDRRAPDDLAAGLKRLADFCSLGMDRTGVDGMAVALDDTFDSLEAVYSTDARSAHVAELEFTLGQGPAHDALRDGILCGVDDLDSERARKQWPLFAAQASASGLGAAHAVPMRPLGTSVGTVSLYSTAPRGLSHRQRQDATAVTDLIGMSLIAPDAGEVIGLGLRMSVHQAAGMVMQQTGTSIVDALVLLKSTAFAEDLVLNDLANDVVAGKRRFRPWGAEHGPE